MAEHIIGARVPKRDAPAKVRGEAVYGHDLVRPGMLEGAILRSPYASARIVGRRRKSHEQSMPVVVGNIRGRHIGGRLRPECRHGVGGHGRIDRRRVLLRPQAARK